MGELFAKLQFKGFSTKLFASNALNVEFSSPEYVLGFYGFPFPSRSEVVDFTSCRFELKL